MKDKPIMSAKKPNSKAKKKSTGKKGKIIPISQIKKPQSSKIGFNTNTIVAVVAIFIVFSIFWNFSSTQIDAREISMNDFVANFKANEYSRLDIRDDGKAFVQGKFIEVAEVEDLSIDGEDTSTDLVLEDDLKEVSTEEFNELITPLNFSEIVSAISDSDKTSRIKTIYIASDFVLLENEEDSLGDFIYFVDKDFDIEDTLREINLKRGDLSFDIVELRYAILRNTEEELASGLGDERFDNIWLIDGFAYALVTDSLIEKEFVNWSAITDDLTKFLQDEGISFDQANTEIRPTVVTQVPWGDIITIVILLGFGMLGLLMFRGIQGSGNQLMKFGKSKARLLFGKKPEVTFKDVAGVDEAKEQLREVVLFLKEPQRFLDMGARIPKGLLMIGSPGTGKTLLARAIAGEAGVPFFHTSGSEFEEMLVGAGASRVRDLFEKAKKSTPAIIFIDEIDAVARKRGTTIQSSTTEQTLNQILVEMDGFEKNTNLIVIAATNRPDVLDKAILRPGRFDRTVVLDLPDIEGRKAIIAIHAKNKPLSDKVDLEEVAKRTVGFSGADLENMLNEAAIIVAKDDRKEILPDDLEEAANKVQMGPAKKRKRSEKELRMTAYHEAGHALVMKLVPEHDPVHRVTIVSRGMALGYTMPLPEKDQVQMSKTQMLSKIKALVAGFVTEEVVFGDVTSGASNDIEKATSIARNMVKSFGMSKKLGLVKYGEEENHRYLGHNYGESKDYSENTSEIIDNEVREIIETCYQEAKKLIKDNRKTLDALVDALMEKEVLDAEEFNAFFPARKSKEEKESK